MVTFEKMNSFSYTLPAQEILFGAGVVAQLSSAVSRFGWQRLMLCTSPSLRANGYIAPIEAALGERLVVSYERTLAHVLDYQLAEALETAIAHNVDAVIGLGGAARLELPKTRSHTASKRYIRLPAIRSLRLRRWRASVTSLVRCLCVTLMGQTWLRAPKC